jgi:hypothetical protein
MDPDTLNVVKDLLKLNDELQIIREQEKEIENRREVCREKLFKKFGGNIIIKTPAGNINIYEKTIQGKLSLEDIRNIIERVDFLSGIQKDKLISICSQECGENSKTSRTLTVSKKARQKPIEKRKNKTQSKNINLGDKDNLIIKQSTILEP